MLNQCSTCLKNPINPLQVIVWTNFVCSQYASMDPRQRRASDGVLCTVKETLSDAVPTRGHRSPLLSYKTEPGAGKQYS